VLDCVNIMPPPNIVNKTISSRKKPTKFIAFYFDQLTIMLLSKKER
jgi:hypothetical protein